MGNSSGEVEKWRRLILARLMIESGGIFSDK